MRNLSADIARCHGNRQHKVGGPMLACPLRDNCLRFLSPPHELRQVYLVPNPSADLSQCDEQILFNGV